MNDKGIGSAPAAAQGQAPAQGQAQAPAQGSSTGATGAAPANPSTGSTGEGIGAGMGKAGENVGQGARDLYHGIHVSFYLYSVQCAAQYAAQSTLHCSEYTVRC